MPLPLYKKICYSSKTHTETFEVANKDNSSEEDVRNQRAQALQKEKEKLKASTEAFTSAR